MSVAEFIENFNGGTRKNRFRLTGTFPAQGLSLVLNDYHVEATTFPASILTENPIDYQGRKIYYPGDRIYGEGVNLWSVSFLDDKVSGTDTSTLISYWEGLHEWHNALNDHEDNAAIGGNPDLMVTDITVSQLNLNDSGAAIKTATLFECWPQAVGPIKFEMQARDQYARFDVTFCFKYAGYNLDDDA
jgi:hypothetical protein